MQFDFVASTGRTATTYLASALNTLPGVVACHEGYVGSDKDPDPLLPLINLENAQAYALPAAAARTVAEKRSQAVVQGSLKNATRSEPHLIDVAYYNAILCSALLAQNSRCRMLGIIRTCGDFVRSATTITGEDPLPVGWPDPNKPMTDREKFIAMGRIRPRRKTPAKAAWEGWSAIRRNIWLWEETNLSLLDACDAFPARARLCRFETFKTEPAAFWQVLVDLFDLSVGPTPPRAGTPMAVNTKPAGYQVGPPDSWTPDEQAALSASQALIDERANYDC